PAVKEVETSAAATAALRMNERMIASPPWEYGRRGRIPYADRPVPSRRGADHTAGGTRSACLKRAGAEKGPAIKRMLESSYHPSGWSRLREGDRRNNSGLGDVPDRRH